MNKLIFSLIMLVSFLSCKPRTEAEKVQAGDAKKTSEAKGSEYILVKEASVLNWTGRKPGGEHHGTVKISEGRLSLDNENITAGNFTFDMRTIICKDLKDSAMNARLVNHLHSEDFFHTSEFPASTFEIVSVEKIANPLAPSSGGLVPTHNVTGNLTMRGTTKSITFPANIEISGEKIKAVTNSFAVDRTEWNVNFLSKSVIAGLKDNFIDDNMIISLELEFLANRE